MYCCPTTKFPSSIPFYAPSGSLYTPPSVVPSILPPQEPSLVHSLVPSSNQYINPIQYPSNETSGLPSAVLSVEHSNIPIKEPSVLKSMVPLEDNSVDPSSIPSYTPSVSVQPSKCTVCTDNQSPAIIANNEDCEASTILLLILCNQVIGYPTNTFNQVSF